MINGRFVRFSGTLLLTAFLLLSLGFAMQGTFETRAEIAGTFARESQIEQAQIDLEDLLRLQINEENSLRGYLLTRDPFYVQQYRTAATGYDAEEDAIRTTLTNERLTESVNLLASYDHLQQEWRTTVAAQLFAKPNQRLEELDKRNKLFSDYEARMAASIRQTLVSTGDGLARSTQAQLDRSSWIRAAWVLVFGLLAIVFNVYRSQLNKELEEEKTVTNVLQRAFRSEAVPLPHCDVASSYVSATSHRAVGGDVFDVYRLTPNKALLLIADISGKGVDAAVLTAFVKFMVRAIALRTREPAAILAEFNVVLSKAVGDPYLFASMFLGVLDTDTFRLEYASAGHDAAFVRRRHSVVQLAITGPVLGVMEEPFGTETIQLAPGDTLLLATDGLTEVRNEAGEQLFERGAMELIERAAPGARELADELALKVREYGGNRMRDDLAILAVRVIGPDATLS